MAIRTAAVGSSNGGQTVTVIDRNGGGSPKPQNREKQEYSDSERHEVVAENKTKQGRRKKGQEVGRNKKKQEEKDEAKEGEKNMRRQRHKSVEENSK